MFFWLYFTMQHTTVKPLGDRVLVKIKDAEEKTAGGILLPANAQGKPQGGEVVAVGEGKSVGKCKVDVSVKVMLLCWQIIDASIYSRFYFSRFWGRRLGGGWRGAHWCVFQERKMRRVATNVYSRKTSEKSERCGLRTLSLKGSGVVFTHGEGISTPRVRHKGRQPLIECAKMSSNCFIFPFLRFYVFLCLFVFLSFCGRQGCFPCSYVFLNCDKEIRPT